MLVGAALGVGSVVPAQTAVNARLRSSIGAPIPASLISFFVALCCAAAVALAVSGPHVDFAAAAAEPWWVWIGGAMGVVFLTGSVVLFPMLGAVETIIIPILGQVIMALVIDHFGLYNSPQNEATFWRVLGAFVVVAGIVIVHVLGTPGSQPAIGEGRADAGAAWGWRAFGVLMGMCSATQTAVNGHLGTVLGSSLQAGTISLFVGVVLLFMLSMLEPTSRKAVLTGIDPGPWWMWLGGVFGAIFVVGMATLAPILGTGTTVIAQLAGAIICGQVIEVLGLFGSTRTRINGARIAGLVLVFIGVAMVRLL